MNAQQCRTCSGSLALPHAQYYLERAESEIAAGNYERARMDLSRADADMFKLSAEERKQNLLTARAFWLQGLIYYHKGQMEAAKEEFLLAEQNLEDSTAGEGLLAHVLNQLGNVALYQRSDTSADYYQRSSELAMKVGKSAQAAVAMGNLGIIYTEKGMIDEAFACYKQALEQAEVSGDILRLGDTYRSTAVLYSRQGPCSKAIEYIEQALALRDEIGSTASVCRIMNDAGRIYLRYGDLNQAEYWLQQVGELAKRTDYKLILTTVPATLAEVARRRGDYETCLSYATAAANQINAAPSQRSSINLPLVLCYIEMGDWAHAQKQLQRLEEICATSDDQFTLERARTMFYAAQGAWEEAESHYQAAKECSESRNDRYEQVNFQEEYATALLRQTNVAMPPAIEQTARRLLAEVADTYRQMEMPLRVAQVEEIARFALA